MEIKAKLNQSNPSYSMPHQQRVCVKAVNVDQSKHFVVRIYEGEIKASNYITEIDLPPLHKIERYITAQNIMCEITSDKVAVGVYHD